MEFMGHAGRVPRRRSGMIGNIDALCAAAAAVINESHPRPTTVQA